MFLKSWVGNTHVKIMNLQKNREYFYELANVVKIEIIVILEIMKIHSTSSAQIMKSNQNRFVEENTSKAGSNFL